MDGDADAEGEGALALVNVAVAHAVGAVDGHPEGGIQPGQQSVGLGRRGGPSGDLSDGAGAVAAGSGRSALTGGLAVGRLPLPVTPDVGDGRCARSRPWVTQSKVAGIMQATSLAA